MNYLRAINSLAVAALISAGSSFAGISIEHVGFTKTVYRADMMEGGEVHSGGTAFVFVRNTGGNAETISGLLVNGVTATNHTSYRWWRSWPETIPPGGVAAISSYGTNAPWADGATTEFVVTTTSGSMATNMAALTVPKLRLGDLVPSQDLRTLNLYLRNLDTVPWTVTEVWLNDDVTAQATFVGGPTVAPTNVLIVKIDYAQAQKLNTNYCIRVRATNAAGQVQVAAPVRLIEPVFHLGTWQSSMLDKEERVDWVRRHVQLNVATGVNGDGFVQRISQMNSAYQRFGLRGIHQINRGPSPSMPDAAVVSAQRNNPAVMGWYLRDEPDLGSNPSSLINEHNQIIRRSDPNHPVTLTMAANHKFDEWGNFVDIPCMDHYAMYAPYVNTFRNHTMDEPLIYSEVLKQNTEPLRMWNWCQASSGGWTAAPPDWSIKIQFWSHIMGGSKGVFWFNARQSELPDFADQMRACEEATIHFNHVRTTVLYSQSISNVATFPLRVEARSLVGEDALVLVVANMNADEVGPTLGPWFLTDLPAASATVTVPDWIPIEQIVEVTTNGAVPANYTNTGRTYTFNFSLHDSRVFLIGRTDTNLPTVATGLNLAWWAPNTNTLATNAVLAWRESFDDFGVAGYKVFRDGIEIADVRSPIYTETNPPPQGARYHVKAYDMAGNMSEPSAAVGFVDPTFRPALNVTRIANGVEVKWSEFYTNYRLQSTLSLTATNWSNIPAVSNRVIFVPAVGTRFLRLVSP